MDKKHKKAEQVNFVRCVDCMFFKTRVIDPAKFLQDEFLNWPKVRRMMRGDNPEKRIYYCYYNRMPYLENPSVHRKVKPDCTHVSPI